jgi:hypothetical protein
MTYKEGDRVRILIRTVPTANGDGNLPMLFTKEPFGTVRAIASAGYDFQVEFDNPVIVGRREYPKFWFREAHVEPLAYQQVMETDFDLDDMELAEFYIKEMQGV